MSLLQKTYQWLFLLGVFFIPFNSDIPKIFGVFGEYGRASSTVFFLGAFVFLVGHQLVNKKFYFPFSNKIYLPFLVFFAFLFLVTALNIHHIQDYYLKFTTGIERFIRQIISILFSAFIFFYLFINVGRDYGAVGFFKIIRKTFLFSFAIVFFVGVIEFLIISGAGFLIPIIKLLNYLPFVEIYFDFRLTRISSITFEPPALGTYLITIAGFMFSYVLTSKNKLRFIPFLLVLLLAIMSKSRTALVVVFFQAFAGSLLAFYLSGTFRRLFTSLVLVGSIVIAGAIIVYSDVVYDTVSEKVESLDFTKMNNRTDDNSISNKSRIGIQVALLKVFKENPITGVGWGQQAFESRHHYPFWTKNENYEFPQKYENKHISAFPPSYNLYLRILAETGILGFILFSFFLYTIVNYSFRIFKNSTKYQPIAVALLISYAGLYLNWFQIDSFRLFGFWLCVALLILLNKQYINEKIDRINSTL